MKMVGPDSPVTIAELRQMAASGFGDLVKAVVDVEQGIMVFDAELHADQEAVLLDRGSRQTDLWGINLYPDLPDADLVEFNSMMNVRPSQGNRSRGVENEALRTRIRTIEAELVVQ